MIQLFNINRYFFVLIIVVFIFQSCKTDEFKFGEIKVKEDFGTKIITPIFSGRNMEFRDFVHDWKKPVPNLPGDKTVLNFINSEDKLIPDQLIFEPSVVIDSFPFYIQGLYTLSEIVLEFNVTNGSPFQLNLQMEFYQKSNPSKLGPAILPAPFAKADFSNTTALPVFSKQTVQLNLEQIDYFMKSDRIKFTSWFDPNEFIQLNDTISAHYPIDISIILIGIVKPGK